jgi:hypothetical protein
MSAGDDEGDERFDVMGPAEARAFVARHFGERALDLARDFACRTGVRPGPRTGVFGVWCVPWYWSDPEAMHCRVHVLAGTRAEPELTSFDERVRYARLRRFDDD